MKRELAFWLAAAITANLYPQLRATRGANDLAVVVNKSNPVNNLSTQQLREFLLGEIRQWPTQQRVTPVLRDFSSAVFRQVLQSVLRMPPSEYQKYLLRLEFRGEAPLNVKFLNSSEGAVKFVVHVPGAFAVVEASSATAAGSQVKVVTIDGKHPGESGYGLH